MSKEEVISWLKQLIERSQNKEYPCYCDCCTTRCTRICDHLVVENTDQTNPKLGQKKRFEIIIMEL